MQTTWSISREVRDPSGALPPASRPTNGSGERGAARAHSSAGRAWRVWPVPTCPASRCRAQAPRVAAVLLGPRGPGHRHVPPHSSSGCPAAWVAARPAVPPPPGPARAGPAPTTGLGQAPELKVAKRRRPHMISVEPNSWRCKDGCIA